MAAFSCRDPIPVPEKVRKPLTQVQQFNLHVDNRAVDRAEFDHKVKLSVYIPFIFNYIYLEYMDFSVLIKIIYRLKRKKWCIRDTEKRVRQHRWYGCKIIIFCNILVCSIVNMIKLKKFWNSVCRWRKRRPWNSWEGHWFPMQDQYLILTILFAPRSMNNPLLLCHFTFTTFLIDYARPQKWCAWFVCNI